MISRRAPPLIEGECLRAVSQGFELTTVDFVNRLAIHHKDVRQQRGHAGEAAAPAEAVSHSSPGTADSGSKSTPLGWSVPGMKRRGSTASTPRSSRDGGGSGSHPSSRGSSAIAAVLKLRTHCASSWAGWWSYWNSTTFFGLLKIQPTVFCGTCLILLLRWPLVSFPIAMTLRPCPSSVTRSHFIPMKGGATIM